MHITCFQPWLRLPPESEKCLVAMVLHRGEHYHARAGWQVWRCVVHRCGESHSRRIGNPGWLRVCCMEIHFQAAVQAAANSEPQIAPLFCAGS